MTATRTQISGRSRRLFGSCSLSAIAITAMIAGAGAAQAQTAPFQSMIAMQAGRVTLPDGTTSVWSGADRPMIGKDVDGRPLMSIHQTRQKALLDWEQFRLQTNEVLEFQQQSADWIAVNRVHGSQASQIDGEIRAKGRVFVFNDNGVLMGAGAKINARQLVTGKGIKDVDINGQVTTLIQSAPVATLNWSDLSSQAGEALRIVQEKKNWVILNRSLATGTTRIGGSIEADGEVLLVGRNGLAIDGRVKAQQVVASALDIRDDQLGSTYGLNSYPRDYNNRLDPTFSNSWLYQGDFSSTLTDILRPAPPVDDPADPLRYKLTVGVGGSIETGAYGKIMLFGPHVVNRGRINVRDEGQVILAAGDNIYLTGNGKNVTAYAGPYNPISLMRINAAFGVGTVSTEAHQRFWRVAYGETYAIGDTVPDAGARVIAYLNKVQADRAKAIGFHARNEGIIEAKRGGQIDFRGLSLEQMGSIEMSSTALFRGSINFDAYMFDYQDYSNGGTDGPLIPGNGDVIFGRNSLTQITPDLDATDKIPLSSGAQSVGKLSIKAARVHMQDDAMIYMPSGAMNVLLDAAHFVLGSNRGAGMNMDNESGVRFMMDRGATIDLSGWKSTILPMGYHQVTGKLFAAQLADSPMQRNGPLYRKEITVDRRYGTDFANWRSFDNLSQGTLAQFLLNGGSFTMDMDDDFIMKPGSVIDVSGGKITYQAGFVETTLIRTLDNRIIDIREADPDQLYMGFANEWTQYDPKWSKQQTYYIPFMSSKLGHYEDGYSEGGAGGSISILAPDVVLQGTLKGGVTVGKYQRDKLPKAGVFSLNDAGESEREYVSNAIRITAGERVLPDSFGIDDKLSDIYGTDLFGEEYEPGSPRGENGRRTDNGMLVSQAMFNRSTMGSYEINQGARLDMNPPFDLLPGPAVVVEKGVALNLANGASFSLTAGDRVEFLGSIRTEGGDVSIAGLGLIMGRDSRIDTRGSWYNEFERLTPVPLAGVPRINGGSIALLANNSPDKPAEDVAMILPETVVIDSSGGGWVQRDGTVVGGKGGGLSVSVGILPTDRLDLGALAHARAYGLGGNGAYELRFRAPILIGERLPADAAPGGLLIGPDFFSGSGFSSIKLEAPSIAIAKDVTVKATSAALVLRVPDLAGNGASYLDFASGSDIYDVATVTNLPLEQRTPALRRGMDLNFSHLTTARGSLLATDAGGTIWMGSGSIAGTLLAPAGKITIEGSAHVASTGKLLAPGAVLVTSRSLDRQGHELIDGLVLPGGTVNLIARNGIALDRGAVIDVSGTSAIFDVPQPVGAGGTAVRKSTLIASDGGAIILDSPALALNDPTLIARAGGAGARGGALTLSVSTDYAVQTPHAPVDSGADAFEFLRYYVYLKGSDVQPQSMYGIDLNSIDWDRYSVDAGSGPIARFPDGFKVKDRQQLKSWLNNYVVMAAGNPTALLIGSNLPADTGMALPVLPKLEQGLLDIFQTAGAQYELPVPATRINPMPRFDAGRVITDGGFGALTINALPGVEFVGKTVLGGRKADGSYQLDMLTINAPRIIGAGDADVRLEANIVRLKSEGPAGSGVSFDAVAHDAALRATLNPADPRSALTINAKTLIDVETADFFGFGRTLLATGGDIRLIGISQPNLRPEGGLRSTGLLQLKADQTYAATGRLFEIGSETGIEVLPQDAGDTLNGTPYEAGARLRFRAPRIEQGGIVRSPLGAIEFEAAGADGRVTLLPGSLSSVNADGHVIPFGHLSNGDSWIDPLVRNASIELRVLPEKAVSIKAASVDLKPGSVIDIAGGGDLYAHEFSPGIGGSNDWLTGYRDRNYAWVSAPGEIFAVLPGFAGDIAPVGLGDGSNIAVGSKVYLSGGSGLAAGYYTLLPAEYALLPGAFRVTARHHYAGDYGDMPLGAVAGNIDGSTIQAGYRYVAGQSVRDQRNSGFLVMNGTTLRLRSEYAEARATKFFESATFLKKSLRANQPVMEIPRLPTDGGSVVLEASRDLTLGATLKSQPQKGGRGGFADISATRIAVLGAGADRSAYKDYLVLDSTALNDFAADSLLLGGVRRQGNSNIEVKVGATDVVIDTHGSVLSGPELLFAATGKVDVRAGAVIQATQRKDRTVVGGSGDLRILPAYAAFTDQRGTPTDPSDDIKYRDYDQGALLRISINEQADLLRDIGAIDALSGLLADPERLATTNAARMTLGLAPITRGGTLSIAAGAKLGVASTEDGNGTRALAFDATGDVLLAGGVALAGRQISAAASRISIGAVPAGTGGLVFSGGSLGALAAAEDIALKSYSSIDFHGGVTLKADKGLTLDMREIRAVGADGELVTIGARTLTLANSNGGKAVAGTGGAAMRIEAGNVRLTGGDKYISGISRLTIDAAERVIGSDDGALYVPGALRIDAGAITADSGAKLRFDAGGAIELTSKAATLQPFKTFGATIGFTGDSILSSGRIGLTGGTVNLRARGGNVELAGGSMIDVTSAVARIFDVEIGVGAGTVNLVADRGDIRLAPDARIDVSGSAAGGDAGLLTTSAGLGAVILGNGIKGDARDGYRSGSVSIQSATLGDFAALNAALDGGGFREARHFEFNRGDATITGTIRVRDFTMVANDGSINLAGTIETVGTNGGRVQLAAAGAVTLRPDARILARAGTANGSGGTVLLETAGRAGGSIGIDAGALIDVSGSGEGGRLVRLRAPQSGGDLAIDRVAGSIIGARTVLAEGFRVYDGVTEINRPLIDRVEADAIGFMAHAGAIRARLGSGVTVVPGIELRSAGDMRLVTDWDLHRIRFDGAAGVLTLRAQGDLAIDANLSDGFDGAGASAALLTGPSWTFNLTAGANLASPNSLAVLPVGLLAPGKGTLTIGGTPDTTEYYYDPAYGNEHRLYQVNPATGRFVQNDDGSGNYHLGFVELTRNAEGHYLDPRTGQPILKDPKTGDYADTATYARRPLPYFFFDNGGGYERMRADGSIADPYSLPLPILARDLIQYDNSTGYIVRTGTAGINIAAGRDLTLSQRPSVIYTAGEQSPALAGFYPAPGASYPINGGDIRIDVAGTINGSGSPQLPSSWLIAQASVLPDGSFAPNVGGRAFDQSSWWIDFSRYQAGVGALGGGNVAIAAGGDIRDLSVNLPTTGRVTGNTVVGEPMALTMTGGGDLTLMAGGDIGSGKFYVAEGLGLISAGGRLSATDSVRTMRSGLELSNLPSAYYYPDPTLLVRDYPIHTLLYTSSGEFRVRVGGDLDLEAVLDPLMPTPDNVQGPGDDANGFNSYTPDARVSLFSAGGDIRLWNNSANIDLEYVRGVRLNPTNFEGTTTAVHYGRNSVGFELWPGTVSVTAASGSINILGGLLMAPAPKGTLDLLAGADIHVGNATRNPEQFELDPFYAEKSNFRSGFGGIILSQSHMELFKTPLQPVAPAFDRGNFDREHYLAAGPGTEYPGGVTLFSRIYAPDLHVGDIQPVHIYAGGNIVTSASIALPKAALVQAGGNIHFPYFTFQHNNPGDLSLVRAGAGVYFGNRSNITVNGPGRLEIETGGDLWIPDNANGIVTNPLTLPNGEPLNPAVKAADIAIGVGYNQRPDIAAFEAAFLDPKGKLLGYVLKDAGDGRALSYYLFDRVYTRGDIPPDSLLLTPELGIGFVNYVRQRQGLAPLDDETSRADYLPTAWAWWRNLPAGETTPFDRFFPSRARAKPTDAEYYLPERQQGLVNYVRGLQGLKPLETQSEQLAYLDTAWSYWQTLGEDHKSPFLRNVLTLELRTTGREANAPDNERYETTFRGYDAIAKLFPGAQKKVDQALAAGESRWQGEFETYASRVLSNGGGQIDIMIPGGALKLANVAASADSTGQPPSNNGQGNALRAGILTANGGAINIFTHDSVTVNQSRVLTANGGNLMIWSSYGDIAAGKGAKTSISPTFYNYTLETNLVMNRKPAGLPTGAGIGTVASIPGAPAADVDLIAPNGIVDAGDAGIRVSGNFNVFAVQILGTDNIDVAGIAIGLPAPPATPIGLIQPTETDAQARKATEAVAEQVRNVQRNAGLAAPSIIEVRVTGFGEPCSEGSDCGAAAPGGGTASLTGEAQPAATASGATRFAENKVRFDINAPTMADAVQAVGRASRSSIVYDPKDLEGIGARPVRGAMTTEDALTRLVRGRGVEVHRVGPSSFMLKAKRRD